MKRRRRIVITIIIATLFCMLAACLTAFLLTFEVEIELSDDKTLSMEVFSEFREPGARGYITLSYINFKYEITLDVTDNINNKELGIYEKKYNVSFLGKKKTSTRKIEVVDTTPPQIVAPATLTVDFRNHETKSIYDIPFTYTAKDLYDGELTEKVTKTYDKEGCTLTVIDKSGNSFSHKILFDFKDKTPPALSIETDVPVYLEEGEEYTVLTYSAIDDVDGDITDKVIIKNLPDIFTAGAYVVSYEVTDSSFNTASATQKVVVHKKWEGNKQTSTSLSQKTIYLTFDDGPGVYTQYLLRKLKEYNVKATFFVTDQFPKYRKLIGEAYKDGHSIGAHTYSHRFDNIYSSMENYLEDFDKIQSVIEEQTGQKTKIFRFPGGTSNTVSQKYATGIMGALVSEMSSQGYVHFDWNFDCGDTAGKKAKQIYNSVLNHIDTRLRTEDSTIILLHDIKIETIKAIPKIIEYCLSKGYTFAGLEENSPNRQFAPNN